MPGKDLRAPGNYMAPKNYLVSIYLALVLGVLEILYT